MNMQLVVHTPLQDYVAPAEIINAAGYDMSIPGHKQPEAQLRLYQWADWMAYCDNGVYWTSTREQ
jgi:hypothetical protein